MGAIVASTTARAAPVVARWVASASPAVVDVVAREVSRKGNIVIKTAKQLVEYVKSSPAKAALVLATMSELGHDVYSWLKDDSGQAPLSGGSASADPIDAMSSSLDKQSASKLALGAEQDVKAAKELVMFLKQQFGAHSPEQVVRLHNTLRLFMSLDGDTVSRMARLYTR